MRHGKAMKEQGFGEDFDRDLEERGKKDAADMARALLKTKYIPDLILASPAKRTRKTAQIVCDELKLSNQNLVFETTMYNAEINDLLHLIREQDDAHKTVMLVGHNPSMTVMIGFLSNTFAAHLPTSGIVVVELDEKTWKLTQSRRGNLVWHSLPKGQSLV